MGLQIKGKGKLLKEKTEIEEATRSDCKTKNDFSEFDSILAERLSPDCLWHYFKVETTEMWLFDSRDFEDVRQKVDFREIKF